MNFTIAIESATKVCSVAIYKDFELLDAIEQKGDYSHAENLAEFVDQLLSRHNLNASDLSAIAISKGPGSYTGLRIGVALAKGLCFSLSIPLIAIDTLEAMAYGAMNEFNAKNGLLIPMIDARRMEVYNAIYSDKLKTIQNIKATIIDVNTFAQYLDENKIYCFGDGSTKIKEVIKHENLVVIDHCLPSARYFGPQIERAIKNAKYEDLAYFEPYYLKDFIAVKSKPIL